MHACRIAPNRIYMHMTKKPITNSIMALRRSSRLSTMLMDDASPPPAKKRRLSKSINSAAQPVEAGTPSTPAKKRLKSQAPPVTPTPAAASLMSVPYIPERNDMAIASHPIIKRLAVPNGTNAPLLTPEHHSIVSSKAIEQASPSRNGATPLTTTTILSEATAHLIRTDERLQAVIDKFPCHLFSPEGLAEEIDPFRALVSGILAQQVSGAAAKAIKRKFVALFHPPPADAVDQEDAKALPFPTPSQVVSMPLPQLRSAGLSQRKAEYVMGLAEKFVSGEITTSFLFQASYEELFDALIKVRGLGQWSVEMFACFALKRMDVFSTGDLGVQRGMARLAGRDVERLKRTGKGKFKYMGEQDMLDMAEKFRPYRSVFMWYMWRVEDVDLAALE